MNKLSNGLNSLAISVDPDLLNVVDVLFEFYSTNDSVEMVEAYADVVRFDCFTGKMLLSLYLDNFVDGEYYVIAYDDESNEIWRGLSYVYNYTFVDGSNGVVVGSLDTPEVDLLFEDGDVFLLEDGDTLSLES